jgi:hypothetical protein
MSDEGSGVVGTAKPQTRLVTAPPDCVLGDEEMRMGEVGQVRRTPLLSQSTFAPP